MILIESFKKKNFKRKNYITLINLNFVRVYPISNRELKPSMLKSDQNGIERFKSEFIN